MINIDLPESVIKLSESAFNECTSIISYNVSNYNQNFSSENGILYNKDRSEIIAFPPKNSIKVFKIPTTVVRIGFNTFRECSNLISIEIPNSVKIIGDIHVQLNTSTIYFLSDFEYDYRIHTFYNCHNLNELHCRIRNIKDVFISRNVFDGCNLDKCSLYVPIGTGYAYRHHPVFSKFKEIIIEK